ncbi:MAG: extracellular solute-binding protein [Candidatus Dojkabacteria bacterium]|nr:extracellular solute-binding protein [Candidatus Dojkabacteria bacterium]
MDSGKRTLLIAGAVLLVLVAVIAFVVVSRLRGNNNGSSGEPVEIVYWGLWEPESHLSSIIEAYEAEHPNVTIRYSQERFTQYEENVYTRLADPQTTPDIVRINNAWTSKFQDRLSPVPPEIMSVSEYQQTFYSCAQQDFTGSDGYLYAIPLEVDGLALFYNKDLFEQAGVSTPPRDWDTMIETAKKLTVTDTSGTITQAGVALGCSNNINHSADILAALMLQNNVPMTSADGMQATFNTSRGQDSLTYYTSFVLEHRAWSCGLRNDLEMFAGGKLAMMFAPSWRVFDIINMNPGINFDTAEFPQLVGNDQPVHFGMYWGDAVSAQSANKYEAWQFIAYLSEQESMKKMYAAASQSRAFGEPYSRKDLADELSDAPYVGPFITMAPYYTNWKIGDQKSSEQALRDAISAVVDSRSGVGSALTEAVTTINEAFVDLYGQSASP